MFPLVWADFDSPILFRVFFCWGLALSRRVKLVSSNTTIHLDLYDRIMANWEIHLSHQSKRFNLLHFFYPQTLTTYCCPTFFYTRFTRVLNGLAEPRTSLLCFTLINLCEVVVPGEEWVSDQSRQHPKSASPFIPTSPACLNRVRPLQSCILYV